MPSRFLQLTPLFQAVENSLLPWALADVDLGDNVLEIGPGYGANIRVLIGKAPHYTAVEIDQAMAERLHDTYSDRARIIRGDGTDTGLPSGEFSAVVCFTMLHHIPTAGLQDRLFAEAFRVLRSGGVFAGSDSASSIPFRVLHFRDICNPVHLKAFPEHLRADGFRRCACRGLASSALAGGQGRLMAGQADPMVAAAHEWMQRLESDERSAGAGVVLACLRPARRGRRALRRSPEPRRVPTDH